MSESEALRQRFEAAMMGNYGTPPLALARGEGSRVWDVDGNRYLDLIAGIAVSALGHAHPAIVSAVTEPGRQDRAHQQPVRARAGRAARREAARPAARRRPRLLLQLGHRGQRGGAQGRPPHSRARAARSSSPPTTASTAGPWARSPSPARSRSARRSSRSASTSAGSSTATPPPWRAPSTTRWRRVILEPTQGEGGVIPAPAGYLAAARRACDEAGALLVLDEIQSGIGRTGAWFAHQAEGVTPDVMTLAKGLGGGLPIGACVGFGEAGSALVAGDHGSTFGGNPIACAAALAVLDTIETGRPAQERQGGRRDAGERHRGHRPPAARRASAAAASGSPPSSPRTRRPQVNTAARQAGFLVNAVQPDAVRLAPPLILTQAEATGFVAALPAILTRAHEQESVTRRWQGTSSATTTSPRPSRPRCSTWPRAMKEDRSACRPLAGPEGGRRCSSTSRACAPASRSPSASPSSAACRLRSTRPRRTSGRGETIADIARVLARQVAAITWRTSGQERIEELAAAATVPVINALTDEFHPCQILADLQTVAERLGSLGGPHLHLPRRRREQHGALLPARRGDRRACTSGSPPRAATSPTRRSSPRRSGSPRQTGGSAAVFDDPALAAKGADVLATDVWVSMGQADAPERKAALAPFQVNGEPARAGRPGRDRAALPARAPRRGDHRRGDRRPGQRGLGPGGEPAARAEGPARLAPGAA